MSSRRRWWGTASADVVVVGGGYTGMWAAWHVKQLEPEARGGPARGRRCGHGPSGRNGGFCNVMWFSLPNMRRALGRRGGAGRWPGRPRRRRRDRRVLRERGRRRLVPAWRATCRSRPRRPTTCLGRGAGGLPRAWRRRRGAAARRRRRSRRAAPRRPSAAAPSTRARRRCSRRGWRWGCASGCAGRGVELFERSPVRRARAARRTASRRARAGGTVRARRAVLAIGRRRQGAGAGRCAAGSPSPPRHIVLTEPVPDVLEEVGWTGGECITDSRALIDYFRTTPDGRIAFGWGGGRIAMGARLHGRSELDAEVVAADRRAPPRLLPRPRGAPDHPRLGRPDRRLADPPAPGRAAARRPRLRRRRLHRQRRRPLPHGRPHPRLPRPRPPRRATRAWPSSTPRRRGSRPSPSTGSAARRSASASDRKEDAELDGRGPAASPRRSAGPRADRLPHRPLKRRWFRPCGGRGER